MLWNIFILVAGLALILVGANILTDGASALARRWGVSDLVVGLTIVAFGTSTPNSPSVSLPPFRETPASLSVTWWEATSSTSS